jgi:ribosomal protein S11
MYSGNVHDMQAGREDPTKILEAESFDVELVESTFDDVLLYFEDAEGNYVQVALRGGWPHRGGTKSTDFGHFFCDEVGLVHPDE